MIISLLVFDMLKQSVHLREKKFLPSTNIAFYASRLSIKAFIIFIIAGIWQCSTVYLDIERSTYSAKPVGGFSNTQRFLHIPTISLN